MSKAVYLLAVLTLFYRILLPSRLTIAQGIPSLLLLDKKPIVCEDFGRVQLLNHIAQLALLAKSLRNCYKKNEAP